MPPEISATKSYRDGRVGIRVAIRASGHGPSVSIQASTDIQTADARLLAAALVALADEADAKVAKKAAVEDRRKKWRDREVEAGRMKIISFR